MLRVITVNLNGIRSAARKGFFDWLPKQKAHIVGVQEIRAQADVVEGVFCRVGKLRGHFHYAERRGYAGVGLYSKEEPSDIVTGIGVPEFDSEGRWIEKRFDRHGRRLSLISCYFPSGSSGEHRQRSKFRFLDVILPHIARLSSQREFILMGDVNIAHHEIDLKNWRSNRKNSGFLPEERAWMSRLLMDGTLVDVYRRLHPTSTDECYTWWSNRGQAFTKNVGWRLDYQMATRSIANLAVLASIYKVDRFSDHAPLTIDYDLKL